LMQHVTIFSQITCIKCWSHMLCKILVLWNWCRYCHKLERLATPIKFGQFAGPSVQVQQQGFISKFSPGLEQPKLQLDLQENRYLLKVDATRCWLIKKVKYLQHIVEIPWGLNPRWNQQTLSWL
jgi:hypothetical protein